MILCFGYYVTIITPQNELKNWHYFNGETDLDMLNHITSALRKIIYKSNYGMGKNEGIFYETKKLQRSDGNACHVDRNTWRRAQQSQYIFCLL